MMLPLSLFKVRLRTLLSLLYCELTYISVDAIKFVDLIHAAKPEPNKDVPQAATAHNTAYDFFSRQPESIHTVLWALSGRSTPKSLRQVEGFGVHT